MAENLQYSTIIQNVISNFNSIYSALATKNVEKGGVVLDAAAVNGRGTAVSEYAGFITNQLFRVEGVTSSTGVTLKGWVIAYVNRDSSKPVSATATINGTDVTITIPASGYYDVAGGKLSASLAGVGQVVNFATTHDNVVAGETKYTITPAEGQLITEVNIEKGSVKVENGKVENQFAAGVVSTLVAGDVEASESPISGGYQIDISNVASYSGTLTAANAVTKKEGYVTADDITVVDFSITKTAEETKVASTKTIYLPKAAISGISGTGSIGIQSDSNLAVGDAYEETGYAITASGTITLSDEAEVTAGYLEAGKITVATGNTSVAPSTIYVKKGSVKTADENEVAVALKQSNLAYNEDSGKYEVVVDLDGTTGTVAIENGYIKETAVPYTLTGGSSTVQVNKGAAIVNVSKAALTESGDTNKILTANPGNAYAITVNSEAAVTKGTVTAGYVKDSTDLTISGSSVNTKTYYVKKGAVGTQVELSATLTDREDSLSGGQENVNIFASAAPAKGDYYTISASSSALGFQEGYIDAVTTSAAASKELFIPKAVFKYVENVDGGNFLEVETGGYIPSGAIANIADITGEIDKAAVNVTLENANVLKTAGSANDYQITVKKGKVNAGYISESDGTLAATESYYVQHGEISLANAISKLEKSAVVATEDGGYKVTVTAAAATTPTLTEGYIKEADIKGLTDGKAVVESTLDVEFAKAGLVADATDKAAIAPTADSGSVKLVDSSAYTINLGLSDNKITAKADTAGYLAKGDSQEITVPFDTKTVYVQSGAKYEAVANVATDNNTTLSANEAGNTLVISKESYDIAVTGTLAEGYYAGENLTVTGKATVAAKSYTVEAASAQAEGNGTASLTSAADGVLLHSAQEIGENASNYYELTAAASGTVTATVSKAGYLKSEGQIATGDIKVTSGKYYIAKYNNAPVDSELVEGTKAHVVTIGANSGVADYKGEQIITADKYVAENIEVKLHADAMGSGVYNELVDLEARLAGTL